MTDKPTYSQNPPNRFRIPKFDHRAALALSAVSTAVFLNITWRNDWMPDTTPMRIGWFMSGQHKTLRAMLFGLVLGALGFLLLVDHAALGWGSSTTLSLAAFVVGLGYWARSSLANLKDRFSKPPTTLGTGDDLRPVSSSIFGWSSSLIEAHPNVPSSGR